MQSAVVLKQLQNSLQAPDGSIYSTFTDGLNNLITVPTGKIGTSKQLTGLYAPDGSKYITITDGNGNLT